MLKKQILFLFTLCAMHNAMAMERFWSIFSGCCGFDDRIQQDYEPIADNGNNVAVMAPERAPLDPDEDKLWYAAVGNDLARVKQLLAAGVNPNTSHGNLGVPLYMAANYGLVDICKALLDASADVNCVLPATRMNPLMLAAMGRNRALCQLFLDAGASVNAVDTHGLSPLHYVCVLPDRPNRIRPNALPICELLLQYGAHSTCTDKKSRKAIYYAQSAQGAGFADVAALLSDPVKIHEVIMREDNPNQKLKKLLSFGPNICNALISREMGRK